MSLVMLDLANARIAEAHLEAERSRNRRRLVIEQRTARQARTAAARPRRTSRLLRSIATAGFTWR